GLVMLFLAGADAITPLLTRYAIDNFIVPQEYQGLFWFGLFYIVLVLFQSFGVLLLIAVAGKIETGLNFNLRRKCYKRLQEMEFAYFDRTPTGWIVARLTSDISRLGDVIAWGIVDFVWGGALMILMATFMFILNWKLALLALALVPLLIYIAGKFQITILRNYRQVRRYNSQITNSFGEGIHGAKTTKTLVREEANLGEFQELNRSMYRYSVKAAVRSALFMPIVLVISTIATGLVIWFGGRQVLAEVIGYGTFVAFISYTLQFFDPVSHLAQIFAEMQNAQAAAERVFSLLELKPKIEDSIPYSEEWSQKRMKCEIEIENIYFAYKEGKPVFQDFSLHIKEGETIALVGETGTGKTTLVNLICRFYEPQKGKIKIDGVELNQMPQEWIHSQLGYVQQVPHLFQGTVRDNIRYGKLDATDEEIEEAAKLVSAHDFIINLPKGYDYKVGESGSLLSTGQRQLISFARVVLADPALLILDEATASIDTETEQLVQQALHRVLVGRTSIIVAHRLSTIRSADRIVLMHKGEIVEMGTHKELMKQKGKYFQLYMNQFLTEEGDRILSQEA
ncbi:MAG: ABC transporter ATP-binding protein/permease, partial [Candidatus Cloacimonetes bacterium]|nr:ABC transporter ATP-binding protein/permease [Candidatus Cloacimonadota bacterium]